MTTSLPPKLDNFIKKYFNTFVYYHQNNQKIAAINLWFNGFSILYRATIIKGFDTYKNLEFS